MDKERIFIFVPGTDKRNAKYYLSDHQEIIESASVSTVALVKLQERIYKKKPDLVLAFCTKEAEVERWGEIKKSFSELGVKAECIPIPNGKNELELKMIIKTMLEKIPEACYLTLDLTHGFRSCPIVFSVAVQYIKFLRRNIEIEGFYYGMIESKDEEGVFLSTIVDLKVYLGLMEWIYAVRVFGDTHQAIQIASLLEPFTHEAGQGKVKSIQRNLIEFSQAYDLACPIEIGLQARSIGRLLETELPKCLTDEVPLAQELFGIISELADKYKVEYSEKKQVFLTDKELKRQVCIIDSFIISQQFDQVLGLIREWMVCCVMYNNGMENEWLIRCKRTNLENKLNEMMKDNARDKQRDLLNDWEYICSLRNPIYHHGFSGENPNISEKRIEKINDIWDKIKNNIYDREYWSLKKRGLKNLMVVINFSHPLTQEHLRQIESITGQPVTVVHNITCQLNTDEPLAPQVVEMVSKVPLTREEWQTLPFVINLPSLNYAAALVLAELHGRMGYFPACLRLRPVPGSVPSRYEVAEILNLDEHRRQARARGELGKGSPFSPTN